MKVLGIDFGLKKVGLALGVNGFAEPLQVIKYTDKKLLVKEIERVITVQRIDKIVVGISEGDMAEHSREFAQKIGAETFDETLSTKDANRLSIEANIKRKKRKDMEDAYAASIMLQNYLDSN